MALSDQEKKTVLKLAKADGYKRDALQDLEDLLKDPRVIDVNYRAPEPSMGHTRHYLVFETDDIYFYDYSDKWRSKLGPFEIHMPIGDPGNTIAEHPTLKSLNGGYEKKFDVRGSGGGYYSKGKGFGGKKDQAGWGSGLIFKGKFEGFGDHTGEGWGFESYHPHVYGGGVNLCVGGYGAALEKGRLTDWIAFMEQTFHFLENGGRQGDDGERHVSMYSNCIKEIFSRNKEAAGRSKPVKKIQRSKSELLEGLGIKL